MKSLLEIIWGKDGIGSKLFCSYKADCVTCHAFVRLLSSHTSLRRQQVIPRV
jgi:hypothetical protein